MRVRSAAFKQLWAAAMSGSAAPAAVLPVKIAPYPTKLVFLGSPGVGKGTYSHLLSDRLGVPHIAMGDLVREELNKSTPDALVLKELVSRGKLLSDDIVLKLLSNRFVRAKETGEDGFILDGFPRTHSQAEVLDQLTEIELVVNLKLREDVLVIKCLGRRICSDCGNNFNLADINVEGENGSPRIIMPALLPPAACASKLIIRDDDTEDVIRDRLRIYARESKPVEDYYKQQQKILDFDVGGGIPETWPRLLHALKLDVDDDWKAQHL